MTDALQSDVYRIADRFVDTLAELDPISATYLGVPGFDHLLTDFSPASADRAAHAEREVLAAMERAAPASVRERRCQETVIEDMTASLERHAAGTHYDGLNILHSPVQSIRQVFDLMPRSSEEDIRNLTMRMKQVGTALQSYAETLRSGVALGKTASGRQTRGCIAQINAWVGENGAPSFFETIVNDIRQDEAVPDSLIAELSEAARSASEGYANFGGFLRDGYLPHAREADAMGTERYALGARSYNGIDLDLPETYEWGWEQLQWVRAEMRGAADRVKSGATVGEAIEVLESDPGRAIHDVDEFKGWMQSLQDSTIADMDGTHFDIAEPVKTIEAMIAPPGGALAMYYTGPTEDFSRPGRTWYPTGDKTSFPLWREVSIAYHEGVPGHHFQIGTTMTLSDSLSRYQRLLAGSSGYSEGWALYAERLMNELGYLDNPDYYMGYLDAQALRSVRIIIDIGMHLQLKIPHTSEFHPGATWSPDLAYEFMCDNVHFPTQFVASEIDRYLGLPGQAISYKVGERVWLEARIAARSRHGANFNLKEWHNTALLLGPMGLEQMKRELAP